MTIIRRRSNNTTVVSILIISLCLVIAVIITTNLRKEENSNGSITRRTNMSSPQQEESSSQPRNKMTVGGYSNIDKSSLMNSEQVLKVANFALMEHAMRNNASGGGEEEVTNDLFLAVSPEEVESGVVNVVVLEAQQQVVAGLNYKLTIALMKDSICLGALKVTVYDRFGDLRVTKWGEQLTCEDVQELLDEVKLLAREEKEEEETALKVEEEIEEVMEEVEPNE